MSIDLAYLASLTKREAEAAARHYFEPIGWLLSAQRSSGNMWIHKSFSVRVKKHGDIAILKCEGRLTIGDGGVALGDEVKQLLDAGMQNVVLDMRSIEMIDSVGLNELMKVHAMVSSRGGVIALVGVEGVTEMSRLIDVFENFRSTEDAIVGIGGTPA